jgi:hypothetical protein
METGDSGYNNPGTALVYSCYFAKFAGCIFLDQRSSAKIWGDKVWLSADCWALHHGSTDLKGASAETLAMFRAFYQRERRNP